MDCWTAAMTRYRRRKVRKIVAGLFMSLDGVVEAPEQWQFPYFNDEMGQALGAAMAASDTLLLGRRTYQEFAAVWPGRGTGDPVGAYMNNTPKLVASTTLDTVQWQPRPCSAATSPRSSAS